MSREIVVNEIERCRLWVAMRLGLGADAFPSICGSVHVEEDNMILAAVVYTNLTIFDNGRCMCWASIAAIPGSNWATRRFIKAILSYVFDSIGACVLVTMTAKSNRVARRFNEHLGLKRAGVVPRAFDGEEDAVHYVMKPEDAKKWLGYIPQAWHQRRKKETA